jgi:hypothetical protein
VKQPLVTNVFPTSHDRTYRLVKQARRAGQCIIPVSEETFVGYTVTVLRSLYSYTALDSYEIHTKPYQCAFEKIYEGVFRRRNELHVLRREWERFEALSVISIRPLTALLGATAN